MPDTPPTSITASTFQVARRVWATSMVRGALFLVVGVVMYLWTSVALDVMTWLLAVLLWLQAVILLVEAERVRGAGGSGVARYWRIVVAVLAVVAGLAVVVWPDKSVTFVLNLVAVWALVAGLVGAFAAGRAYRDRRPSWAWGLTTSLLWIAFGVLVLVKSIDDLALVALALSVYLVATGIVLLVSGFALHVEERDAAALVIEPGPRPDIPA
ncbi:HdeD family acid-resistance protein [Luteimicrobium subarcticum]|uniref:Uncharacterized membrane protein HdeD (DUF308 family) n=1 Tax=Luteimicrobium subarcticum TaxID=620910 RepID=A0A2M8WS50_9MICO|nr:DUF308 domain-containing protein [Luteimicrobium subarcticum]PJI93704.1 uncharacterized membrane protein HdeD (DUF308 family) [Luteimicrobium subarcticum]